MYKKELIIVRHARSKYNMGETTDLDAGITEFGKQQSSNVGKFLRDKVDLDGYAGFTSPFLRCLETTVWMVSQLHDIKQKDFKVMSELREYLNHSGDSVAVPNRQSDCPTINWLFYPNEGEAYKSEHNEEFLRRMHCVYQMLPEKSIVITHGLPALLLIDIATKNSHSVPVWDHSIDNCSVTMILNGRTVWYGRNLFNEVDYKPDASKLREFDNFKSNKF